MAQENKLEPFLADKRCELIWALSAQGYNYSNIGRIFGLNPSSVLRIIRKKPSGWVPKWIKRD